MQPLALKRLRLALRLRQEDLAQKLKPTRMTVTRYERGTHRIPGAVEVAISQFASQTLLRMAGVVAAGRPIEPVLQAETWKCRRA